MKLSHGKTRIRSVKRTIDVLSYVARAEGCTATQVALELGVPAPTAHHLLATLVDEGALVKYERRYHLGPRIGILAEAFLQENRAPVHLLARLERFVEETGETAYVSGWRRGEIVVLASLEGTMSVKV